MQAELLTGIAVALRWPNLRRIFVVVLCAIKPVLMPAKDSTILKQSAARVLQTLIEFCAEEMNASESQWRRV
jgi:hypothetical protein